MKYIFLMYLLFVVSFLGAMAGCSDSITNSGASLIDTRTARVEGDFAANPNLKTVPGAVVIVEMEDLNSPVREGDTGPIGEDIIPYTFNETAQRRFTIGDSSYFTMKLVSDSAGAVVVELVPNSTALVNVPAGNYKMHLISLVKYSDAEPEPQMVFIQKDNRDNPNDLNMLLQTNKCTACDFYRVNLRGKVFPEVPKLELTYSNFYYADLRETKMRKAEITSCLFSGTDMTGANLDSAFVMNTKFNSSELLSMSLNGTVMLRTNFDNSILGGTGENLNMGICNFSSCELSGLNIEGSNIYTCVFMNSTVKESSWKNSVTDGCDFEYANIENCDFFGTSFKFCKFLGSKITGCNVKNANFCVSTFQNTIVRNCVSNSRTRCWNWF
jgi:uncharacterized protein YjbI with pentapeptide repeats